MCKIGMAWTILCRAHFAEKLYITSCRDVSAVKRTHCSFRGLEFSLSTHPGDPVSSSGLYPSTYRDTNKIESSASFTSFPQKHSVHLRGFSLHTEGVCASILTWSEIWDLCSSCHFILPVGPKWCVMLYACSI